MTDYNFVCEVASESNPQKKYSVKMREDGLLTCNCPAWIYNHRRNRTCKHIDKIRDAGFTSDSTGKFISVKTEAWNKSLLFCKKYPDGCSTCKLRYTCFLEKDPTFQRSEVEDAGVLKKSGLWVAKWGNPTLNHGVWITSISHRSIIPQVDSMESKAKVFTTEEKDAWMSTLDSWVKKQITWTEKIKES
jgi:hypothetical protein